MLWLIFAVFGSSHHRNLFCRKTDFARGCFTWRSVSRIPFPQAAVLKLRNGAKMFRIIFFRFLFHKRGDNLCYRQRCNRHNSHSRGDLINIWGFVENASYGLKYVDIDWLELVCVSPFPGSSGGWIISWVSCSWCGSAWTQSHSRCLKGGKSANLHF